MVSAYMPWETIGPTMIVAIRLTPEQSSSSQVTISRLLWAAAHVA